MILLPHESPLFPYTTLFRSPVTNASYADDHHASFCPFVQITDELIGALFEGRAAEAARADRLEFVFRRGEAAPVGRRVARHESVDAEVAAQFDEGLGVTVENHTIGNRR